MGFFLKSEIREKQPTITVIQDLVKRKKKMKRVLIEIDPRKLFMGFIDEIFSVLQWKLFLENMNISN